MKPGYKQTDVGVIPEEWEECEIGKLNPFITSGSRGWAEFYSDRGSPFVRITNMSRESIYLDLSDLKLVMLPTAANEGTRTHLQDEDVLVSITADIGIIGYVDENLPKPAYINQHIALVRFDPIQTESKFVGYYLAAENSQKMFRGTTDTGAKAGMSLGTVRKIRLAYPPLPEQRAIAAALSDVDALIGALDRLIAKKRELKQAAMQQLLAGQTRLPGCHSAWEEKTIQELSHVGRGRVISHTAISKSFSPTYPVFSSQTSNSGIMGYLDTYDFEGDHVTWTTDGANAGTVFARSGRFNCTNVCGTIKLHDSDHHFIAAALGRVSQSHVSRHLGNPKLMNDVMKKIKITIPKTRAEQTAIAAVLTDMDAELAALEQRRDKTRALKQGMMQELLTGRIRLV